MLALSLILTGCQGRKKTAEPQELMKIKVTTFPYIHQAPLFLAQDEGYFREQGIEVEFVELQRSTVGIPSLAAGELDVLTGAVNAGLINAIAREARIKIVADRGSSGTGAPAITALLIRGDLVKQGLADSAAGLRGKVLDSSKDTMSAFFVAKALEKFNLEFEEMTLRDVPSSAALDAVSKGSLDLIQATEPWITRFLDTGDVEMWVPDYEVIPDYQYSFTAFGPTLLEGNPEAGKKFMIAYLRGIRRYNEGKTRRNLETITKYTSLETDLLTRMGWPPIRSDGSINIRSIEEYQKWAMEKGLIDRILKPEEYWDPSFVEFANSALETSAE